MIMTKADRLVLKQEIELAATRTTWINLPVAKVEALLDAAEDLDAEVEELERHVAELELEVTTTDD
jgi:hypothetical protein